MERKWNRVLLLKTFLRNEDLSQWVECLTSNLKSLGSIPRIAKINPLINQSTKTKQNLLKQAPTVSLLATKMANFIIILTLINCIKIIIAKI